MTGCTDEDLTTSGGQGGREGSIGDPTGTPVLFTVGNVNSTSTTRADVIPYMAQGGRFVCSMYYHPGASDTDESNYDIVDKASGGTMASAWLMVNNKVGNSVYRKNDFSDPTNLDDLEFDKDATIFYWQNRLKHAFLALADYNKLKKNTGILSSTASENIGKLKMYPNYDKDMVEDPGTEGTAAEIAAYQNTLLNNRYVNTYDLTRQTGFAKMQDQPDPILAYTIMTPGGATQEANRVRLYFKHQFSQIQVNIKGSADNSADLSAGQIDKVELLGISEKGYVCCRLNQDGTVGPATAEDVILSDYEEEVLTDNPYGTSFEMFDMANGDANGDGEADGTGAYASGYLKSFNAIAFGNLQAIRISWHETAEESGAATSTSNGIEHVSTFLVPLTNEVETDDDSQDTQDTSSPKEVVQLRTLQSGMKYIYNLELRRGTLAVIRTEIIDWNQKEDLVYDTDGTITN